jgi:hypothetical protein
MKRPMVRIAGSLVAALAAVLLAVGGMAVFPATSASASTSASGSVVTAWFSGYGTGLQFCDDPGTSFYNGAVVEVDNPCGARVWVHYVAGTTVQSYCVNPGGLAYHLPITWAGDDTTDIQLTTNTSQCDSSELFVLNWCSAGGEPCPNALPTDPPPTCGSLCDGAEKSALTAKASPDAPDGIVPGGYYCQPGQGPGSINGFYVFQLWNAGCDFRIWLHSTTSGTEGQSLCVGPGQITQAYNSAAYVEVQETNNQAPCSAGAPPYQP